MTELDPEALRVVTGGLLGGRLFGGGGLFGGRLFSGLRARSSGTSMPEPSSGGGESGPVASAAPAASRQAPVRSSGGCGS